jgi:hypothetical protein
MFAVISPSPDKPSPVEYMITKRRGTSAVFVEFLDYLFDIAWLSHDDIIIMDNARIHTGGAARDIEDTLYNTVVDGRALRILIIWLPAHSPELNRLV